MARRNHRRPWGVGVQSQPGKDVGEIHAGGPHGDANFAVAGRRIGGLADLEDLGGAVSGDHHLAHETG